MSLSTDQIILVLGLVMAMGGGTFALLCGLLSYIFNSRIKDTDRRLDEYQKNQKDDIGELTKEVRGMKANIFDLTIAVANIKRESKS